MKSYRAKLHLSLLTALGLSFVILFQNCSKNQFGTEYDLGSSDLSSAATASGGTANSDGSYSGTINVVCNVLTGSGSCENIDPSSGLLGNVYTYPNGVGVNTYIEKGLRLPVMVQLTNLNIPDHDWQTGFSTTGGSLVKDANGDPLIEWFAIDMKGYFTLPNGYHEDFYQFAVASDDGSLLDIDDRTVVDNDGNHGMRWACASAPINLWVGSKHNMRVRYYQGPRVRIGLVVYFRPWTKANMPCNETGGFEVVPAAALSH